MSNRLPSNISLKCTKKSLAGLTALLLPASDELVTMQGAPVGKLFTITFKQLHPTLTDGDLVVNEADSTDTYRLRGVKQVLTPRLDHTHSLAEKGAY